MKMELIFKKELTECDDFFWYNKVNRQVANYFKNRSLKIYAHTAPSSDDTRQIMNIADTFTATPKHKVSKCDLLQNL